MLRRARRVRRGLISELREEALIAVREIADVRRAAHDHREAIEALSLIHI